MPFHTIVAFVALFFADIAGKPERGHEGPIMIYNRQLAPRLELRVIRNEIDPVAAYGDRVESARERGADLVVPDRLFELSFNIRDQAKDREHQIWKWRSPARGRGDSAFHILATELIDTDSLVVVYRDFAGGAELWWVHTIRLNPDAPFPQESPAFLFDNGNSGWPNASAVMIDPSPDDAAVRITLAGADDIIMAHYRAKEVDGQISWERIGPAHPSVIEWEERRRQRGLPFPPAAEEKGGTER